MKLFLQALMAIVVGLLLLACKKATPPPVQFLEVRFDNTNHAEYESNRTRMREFLWNSWKNRQPARLLKVGVSKEGKRSDTTYEIKEVGSTILTQVSFTHYRYGYNGQVIPKNDGGYDIYTIERVQPNNPYMDLNSKVDVVPLNKDLPSSEYCLRFKGWGGTVEGFL